MAEKTLPGYSAIVTTDNIALVFGDHAHTLSRKDAPKAFIKLREMIAEFHPLADVLNVIIEAKASA